MAANVGDRAPDFTLKDQDKRDVSLDQFGGRPVVLVFFPLAFSPVCTIEMSKFSSELSKFNEANAQVLGISVDSPYVLKVFAEQQNIHYPMLSDFNKEVSKDYGAYYEDLGGLKGVSKRSVFVLDRQHIIRYKWISEDSGVEPNYEEIVEFVDRLPQPAGAR